jgi:hypothetical protein
MEVFPRRCSVISAANRRRLLIHQETGDVYALVQREGAAVVVFTEKSSHMRAVERILMPPASSRREARRAALRHIHFIAGVTCRRQIVLQVRDVVTTFPYYARIWYRPSGIRTRSTRLRGQR